MAKVGFRYAYWAKATEGANGALTYAAPKIIGRAVSGNLQWTKSTGEFYADDELAEKIDDIIGGNYTMDVDNVELADQAEMLGSTYTAAGGLITNKDDNPPFGGFGGVRVLRWKGTYYYEPYFFYKAQASVTDESDNTKTASPSFGTKPLDFTLYPNVDGNVRAINRFTTEAEAITFLNTCFGVTST